MTIIIWPFVQIYVSGSGWIVLLIIFLFNAKSLFGPCKRSAAYCPCIIREGVWLSERLASCSISQLTSMADLCVSVFVGVAGRKDRLHTFYPFDCGGSAGMVPRWIIPKMRRVTVWNHAMDDGSFHTSGVNGRLALS